MFQRLVAFVRRPLSDQLKGLSSWAGSAFWWIVDKAFGDALFRLLTAPVGMTALPPWAQALAQGLWSYGPPLALLLLGIHYFRRANAVRPDIPEGGAGPPPAPFWRRAASVALPTSIKARIAVGIALLFAVGAAAIMAVRPEDGTTPPAAPPVAARPARPPLTVGSPADALREAFGPNFGTTRVQRAFLNEFQGDIRAYRTIEFNDVDEGKTRQAYAARIINFESNSDFLALYAPASPLTFALFSQVANDFGFLLNEFRYFMVTRQDMGDVNVLGGRDLKFTGAVYLYTEDALSIEEMAELRRLFRAKGVNAHFKHFGTLPPERDAPASAR